MLPNAPSAANPPFRPSPFASPDSDILRLALPPATDPTTYLTLLEYQLIPERLPLLHDILSADENAALTSEIGWDLVGTLVKFLPAPAASACLDDVARLGNPREVILSVAGELRKLAVPGDGDDEGDEGSGGDADADVAAGDEPDHLDHDTVLLRYEHLLSMLPILQSRLVSKTPSRFLATAMQDVFTALTSVPGLSSSPRAINATLVFLRSVSGTQRPPPPPRRATTETITDDAGNTTTTFTGPAPPGFRAGDPENEQPSGPTLTGQRQLVTRLTRYMLLELLKIYMGGVFERGNDEGGGRGLRGLSWALRMEELRDPRAQALRRSGRAELRVLSVVEAYRVLPALRERDEVVAQILRLAEELGVDDRELLDAALRSESRNGEPIDLELLPQEPSEIVFQRHGCLLLLAARVACQALHEHEVDTPLSLDVLPTIFAGFMSGLTRPDTATKVEDAIVVDVLLTLAVTVLGEGEKRKIEEEAYKEFVTRVTACTRTSLYLPWSSMQRVAAKAYGLHPDSDVRYEFLSTVLSARGHEDLFMKEPALDWLKAELLGAGPAATNDGDSESGYNAFSSPAKVTQLLQSTFSGFSATYPPLHDIEPEERFPAWFDFVRSSLTTCLAYLNLYLLLTRSRAVLQRVALREEVHEKAWREFFQPLRGYVRGEALEEEVRNGAVVEQFRGGVDLAVGLIGDIERWGESEEGHGKGDH